VEDGAGEGAGEGSDPHQVSQHTAIFKTWVGQSEVRDEVLPQAQGIMRKNVI
jgi:hypothetical protein